MENVCANVSIATSQHSNSAACLLACHLEVLVSSRNTKELHDLPILCPASSRELHVSRALAHSHPNRKAHVHTNTTNVAEQQAALPRGVPGRRIKPAMRLENDFSLAPFIRQMSKPTRMTGTNRSLGIVCKHMFLFRLRPSLRGTMSLVRMISGSPGMKSEFSSHCFLSPTPPGCTFTSAKT